MVSTVGGLVVSFATSWRLSLVMCSFGPLMVLSGLMYTKQLGASTRENMEADSAKVRGF